MDTTQKRILIRLRSGFFLMIWFGLASAQYSPVRINEFLASNVRTNAEMLDFGDFSDWLELYNPADTTFILNGIYLSDNPDEPLKWRIPDGVEIPAGGYQLFWADGFDDIPGIHYTRPYWPWDSYTTENFHTSFKISADGEFLGIYQVQQPDELMLISPGSSWHYLDDGTDQGETWREPDFNHSGWSSGPAQLGYGDGDEATVVGFGPDDGNKFITTYFRHEFEADIPVGQSELELSLLYDDGAVVYLNGNELLRVNLHEDPIDYTTTALTYIGGDDEDDFHQVFLSASDLVAGSNILAVEIHQYSGSSSDISFDLELQLNTYGSVAVLDSISFGQQVPDISSGRFPDGTDSWRYYGDPTPGSANLNDGRLTSLQSESAQVQPQAGLYAGPLSFTAMAGEDESVHFSLDGSRPDAEQPEMSDAMELSTSSAVRTRVYSDDTLPSYSTWHSYLIDEPATELPIISIIADPYWLWDAQMGIYANELKQREIPAALQFFSPSGELMADVQAGVRLAGLNIWRFAQKPLLIHMRDRYGFDELDSPVIQGNQVSVFTEFVFRNGGDDWEGALLRDAMTPAILGETMNNARQGYQPYSATINGEYWGIYNLREKFDDTYFREHFGLNPDELDYMGMTVQEDWVVVEDVYSGSRTDYDALLEALDTQDLNDSTVYTQIQSMMDMDDFMDFLMIQQYVANTSWRHNREWWKSASMDDRWRWIVVDLDRGFNPDNINRNLLSEFEDDFFIFNRLAESSFFKNRFLQRFAAHLQSTFLPDRIIAIVDTSANRIASEMPRHIERWSPEGGIADLEAWNASLEDIREFARNRNEHIYDHLESQFNTPGFIQVTIEITGEGALSIEGVPLPDTTHSVQMFGELPVRLKALPDPAYTFSGWGNGISDDEWIGTISGDTTLTLNFSPTGDTVLPTLIQSETILYESDSPFLLAEDLLVDASGSLVIMPGCVVRAAPNASLVIQGGLQIMGTESEPVVFQPNSEDEDPSWGAICLDHSVLPVTIEHLVLQGASHGPDPLTFPAAISCLMSSVSMDHSDISGVPFPVYAEGGETWVTNSDFEATASCDYINVRESDQVLIQNCRFFGINFFDTDAIDLDQTSGAQVLNNYIYHFSGDNSDGIDIGEQSSQILIEGNYIYSCFDKGISVGQQSSVEVSRNLIVDCGYGIAVKDSESLALVDQNTLFGNDIQLAAYEKNPGAGGGTILATNTILANTLEETLYSDEYSVLTIGYSLCDTGMMPGVGNLYADPEFMAPTAANFELRQTSPAWNSGSPGSPNDPDGSPADIGAYYTYQDFDYPFIEPSTVVINEIMYNDPPDQDTGDWVEFRNVSGEPVNLRNWSFKDGNPDHNFIIEQEIILQPQEFLVLSADRPAFLSIYSGIDLYSVELDFGFTSSGELLRLIDDNGRIQSTVYFLPVAPWPVEADGNGSSLERIHPQLEGSVAESWAASIGSGTPGMENSQFAEPCDASGDLNLDGSLDVLDIVQLVSIILDENPPSEDELCTGDLNQDGSLDVLDVVLMVDCVLVGC